MEIKVPASLKDCTIQQVWDISHHLATHDPLNLDHRIEVVSIMSGVDRHDLMNADIFQINKIYAFVIDIISEPPIPLPDEVVILGKTYTVRRQFTAGQFIDFDINRNDPVRLASICYVENGLKYAQKDEHRRIINPASERDKVFRDHFPGDVFLSMCAFFLDTWQKLQSYILEREMRRMKKLSRAAMKLYKTGSNGYT